MKHAFVLRFAVLWFALSSASVAWSQVDPLTLWTWSDGASCDIRNDGNFSSTVGCCGSPGWRACGYVVNWNKGLSPGCTDPGQNILRTDSYDHTVICNLDSPPIVIPPLIFGSTSTTFYVGTDFHVFRSTFDPTIQSPYRRHYRPMVHQQALNGPPSSGIPAPAIPSISPIRHGHRRRPHHRRWRWRSSPPIEPSGKPAPSGST